MGSSIYIELSEPASAKEMAEYFDFRWRELREPWQQPRGSERDELEASARHIAARAVSGEIIGVGRIHWNDDGNAQIRYVATARDHLRRGVGAAIMRRLEQLAEDSGACAIVLNAREIAVPFYSSLGYEIIGEGPTIFGTIAHKRMQKKL
jgi:GNAT superfamily N-acetyltransferase